MFTWLKGKLNSNLSSTLDTFYSSGFFSSSTIAFSSTTIGLLKGSSFSPRSAAVLFYLVEALTEAYSPSLSFVVEVFYRSRSMATTTDVSAGGGTISDFFPHKLPIYFNLTL